MRMVNFIYKVALIVGTGVIFGTVGAGPRDYVFFVFGVLFAYLLFRVKFL